MQSEHENGVPKYFKFILTSSIYPSLFASPHITHKTTVREDIVPVPVPVAVAVAMRARVNIVDKHRHQPALQLTLRNSNCNASIEITL
ncbi:hypothetical protein sscle_01g006480 [Sclerotinia sclerotiorum 1980 UF-70]|uniref:Uncharacterized protein n=1 Tax=Sclerotinia sclerotiorum (strain ATCC 18683 / 1980 / Ss-1) TaxID=665079 RepID=A0A1D9PT31_SCLS1|nr:hypothetical protein sscle_01g006480 [Sclerotinia sclerotiorum 1980 UF-70]